MDEKVLRRIFEHAEYVDNHLPEGHHRIFTALQGSQNYSLSDAESDVDTKSLTIPCFEELLFNKKRLSTTLVLPNNEHADVKDAREMFLCFRKQNINFLEILFTPYVDVAPGFEDFYEILYNAREDIARLNPYQGMRAMIGHMEEKYHAFEHPYPSIIDKIEKFRYDPKQLHHLLRFKEFLIRFIVDGDSYEDCLTPKNPGELLAIKRGSIPYDEACVLKEDTHAWMHEFLEEWKPKLANEENPETSKLMDDVLYQMFAKTYHVGG